MAMTGLSKDRKIDIVFCIDATSSMGPCIDNVRNHAKNFYRDFTTTMTKEYSTNITSLRVQIIVFRDLECDVDALVKSEFFELPMDAPYFEDYLNRITPRGGGDYKESGLEALYTAMTTKWEAKGTNDRQVIVLFTDADAIDFGEKSKRDGYPTVCDSDKFHLTWSAKLGNLNTIQERSKRLVMFAPAKSVYASIQSMLNRSQLSVVAPQLGMSDISFDAIIKIICASASSNT